MSVKWSAAVRRQLSLRGLMRTPPIWREGRMLSELAALTVNPIAKGGGLPDGKGRPVFLIPGYMAGDAALAPMARALRGADFRPETAGLWLNVGCMGEMVAPIEARLAAMVEAHGRKVVIIGQSRGGAFGRLLAGKRPDLVAGLVTLGTPLHGPLALNVLVLANIRLISALGSLGVPGLHSTRCMHTDGCCSAAWNECAVALPDDYPFLSIYSRSDGIVDWRACVDPAGRNLEVDSSHCGMAFHVDVLRGIAEQLAKVPHE